MSKEMDENELSSLFEPENNNLNGFEQSVKKAQRKVLNRQIILSALVSLAVGVLVLAGWLSLMGLSQANAIQDERIYNTIRNPNVYEVGYQMNEAGLFEGSLVFTQYKMLGNKPINWSNEIIRYNLFGRSTRILGDHSPIQVTDENDGLPRFYNRDVKERLMQFYYPSGHYKTVRNDLNHLSDMSESKTIEIALSFDNQYTPEEVREFLPDQVSLKWYWVDTFPKNESRINPVTFDEDEVGANPLFPDEVIGFSEVKDPEQLSEEYFLRDLKEGIASLKNDEYSKDFERIFHKLRAGKKEPSAQEIPIIGVVATGTPKELLALKGVTVIRASVFGAITENDY